MSPFLTYDGRQTPCIHSVSSSSSSVAGVAAVSSCDYWKKVKKKEKKKKTCIKYSCPVFFFLLLSVQTDRTYIHLDRRTYKHNFSTQSMVIGW